MRATLQRDHWLYIVGTISGGHFLSHFYILAFPPLFPMWKAQFGLSNTQLGFIMSASLIASLFQVPVGNLVDRIGAKWVFTVGLLLTSGGVALVGVADSYGLILLFAVVSGLGQVSFHPSDYAMINTVTDGSTRGKGFSYHTFSGYLGFAAAPVIVGTLAVATSWQVALFVTGGFGLAYALFAGGTLKPAYRQQLDQQVVDPDADDGGGSFVSEFTVLLKPTLLLVFLFFIVFTTAIKGIQTFTTIGLVDSFSYAEAIGNTSLTVYFASAAVGILAGGVLADRYRSERIIVGSLLVTAAALVIATVFVFPIGVLATLGAFAVVGFFAGVVYPSRDQLISRFSADSSVGTSFGFVYTGTTIGGLVSPPILGRLIDLTAPWVVFIIISGSFAAGAGLIFVLSTGRARLTGDPVTLDD